MKELWVNGNKYQVNNDFSSKEEDYVENPPKTVVHEGRTYRVLSKCERSFSLLERIERVSLGVFLVLGSFGFAALFEWTRSLFTKENETIHYVEVQISDETLAKLKEWKQENPSECIAREDAFQAICSFLRDPNKQEINLSCKNFSSLPDIWADKEFFRLTSLDLSHNQIQTIQESLGSLTALRILNLSRNQIRIIPGSIGSLVTLYTLNFASNQIEIIPNSIGSLTALERLNFAYNQVKVIPETIANLSSLSLLDLSHNKSLKSLSNASLRLPTECTIDIEGCGFSEGFIEDLTRQVREPGYKGPRITAPKQNDDEK